MAVNYNVAVKTARMTATRDYFANGAIELLSGATVVASHGLELDGGDVAGDVWTLVLDAATVAAAAAGTVDGARVVNAAAAAHLTGLTVGVAGSGADVILDNLVVAEGQNITINSATITHAA